MDIVESGGVYSIYNNGLNIYKRFPTGVYRTFFDPQSGPHVEEYGGLGLDIGRTYGDRERKVDMVFRGFEHATKSLGVLLSGDKGIGKTVFARMLAKRSLENDIPVIVVDSDFPGISNYIAGINQEVMIFFDEFDKTFATQYDGEGDEKREPQNALLSLFDGTSSAKHLNVITVNSLYNVSNYLINRPGRFHYHIRFKYPDAKEIRLFLKDNIPEGMYEDIESIISFSEVYPLNYDCLQAIAMELRLGNHFDDVIEDMNIINYDVERSYSAQILHNGHLDGEKKDKKLNLLDDDISVTFDKWMVHLQRESMGRKDGMFSFVPSSIYDIANGEWLESGRCKEFEVRLEPAATPSLSPLF